MMLSWKVRAILLFAVVLVGLGAMQPAERAGAPTVVYIVRHAEKLESDRPLTNAEDKKVDLLQEGHVRAEVLAWMLQDVKLDAIYSTNYKRTLETVGPVAKQKKLMVDTTVSESGTLLQHLLAREQAGKTLLVCNHSNGVPKLLRELGVYRDNGHLKRFDNLFIVVIGRDAAGGVTHKSLQRLHYPGLL